jgi:transcriptional regulator with XRE-family HTH domain
MIAKKIKELRRKFSWSQQKLAEKAELSYNTITKIEQGAATKPTIQTMIKIADAFGIGLDDLVGRKKNNRSEKY